MINTEDYRTPLPGPGKEDDDASWSGYIDPTSNSDRMGAHRPAWRNSCLRWTASLIEIANDIHRSL